MFTHVAFLRGMNLGRRRITNPELVAAFDAIGIPGAVAFQASGNVLFSSGMGGEQIASGLGPELGYPVPTFVRTAEDVRTLAAIEPFGPAVEPRGKLQVTLLAEAPGADAIAAAEALDGGEDRVRVIGREWFWWPSGGVSESDLDVRAIEAALGTGTTRTQATLQRIAKKL
ncbi:MAG: DUF1697 domain-containing protein [Pseudomonadota bacterium]